MSLGEMIRQRREDMKLTQDQVASQTQISKPYLSNVETGRAKNPPSNRVLRALEKTLKFEPRELIRVADRLRAPREVIVEKDELEKQVARLRTALQELAARTPAGGAAPAMDPEELKELLAQRTNVHRLPAGIAVPIINNVVAGYPAHFTDLDYPPSIAEDYVRCPDLHDPQAFAARIVGDSMEPAYVEGDLVVFAPNTPARSGDDCFVRFEDDASTTFKRAFFDSDDTIRLQPMNAKYPPQVYKREQVSGLWPALFRIQRLR